MAIVLKESFDDYDEFSEKTRDWNLRTTLLKPGGFGASVFQYIDLVEPFHLGRVQFRTALRQAGSPPLEMLTFVVPARFNFEMDWRRQKVTGHDIAVFPVGGELNANVRNNTDIWVVSFLLDVVMQTADELGYSGFSQMLSAGEVFRCAPEHMISIRQGLHGLKTASQMAVTTASDHRLRRRLLETVIVAVDQSHTKEAQQSLHLRQSSVKKAEEYIIAHAGNVPTVRDLCKVTGASERTLQMGFKDRLGVSPNAFIKAVRLEGVRRELRNLDRFGAHIGEVANRWGFWHMGQFAMDYKRMFLELPSETMSR